MDYSATIQVTADPETASHAIRKEMHLWWSTRVELKSDGATVRFNNSHVTFGFDPNGHALEMIWPCTKAHMIIEDVADTEEWEGTLKWSGKTGQRAKMYPTMTTGYRNDQETQFFRQV